MKVRHLVLAGLLLATTAPIGADAPPPRRVVGYFIGWGIYGRQYFVKNVADSGSAARMTHLLYAFAGVGSDLKCHLADTWADHDKAFTAGESVDGIADTWEAGVLRGNFNQLRKLKLLHPHLKVLAAIGGWTLSRHFSDAALTPASREDLATSAVDLFISGNFAPDLSFPGIFDGLEIDWEYPAAPGMTNDFRPEDTRNFTLLLQEFRRRLDEQGVIDGREYLLSIAAPAGPEKLVKIEIAEVAAVVDFINLMTYDFHGTWEAATNFHAPLFEPDGDPAAGQGLSAGAAVDAYLAAGAPAGKLNLGVPFYGRGWQGVPAGPGGAGLFETGTGPAPGAWEAGVEDYEVLAGLGPSYERHRDAASGAPWLFDPVAQRFWTYEDPVSAAAKMDYVVAKGLGGAMFWELSGDDPAGTLLAAIADGLDAQPPAAFTLTVISGSGGGEYAAGTPVAIAADAPPEGMVFAGWIGATVADAGAAETTLVMPGEDTVVTATYEPAPPGPLAVDAFAGKLSGRAGGDRCTLAATVTLPAPPPDLAGGTAVLSVAGQTVEFTFGARGRAKSAEGTLTAKRSRTDPATILFRAKLKGLTLAPGLRAAGLDPGLAHRGSPVDLPVSVRIPGLLHRAAEAGVHFKGSGAGKGTFR
ncbi:MAG: glycosyl hydrolase family 18 protein [Planctomycetes bacterium]|nr:glycosyl hydrolase family 18 protein [Planctomycetota bacterium]